MVPCPVVGMSILSQPGCLVAGSLGILLIEHPIQSVQLICLISSDFAFKNANQWAFRAKSQGTSSVRHRGFGFAVAELGEVDPVTTEVRAGDFVYGL